MSDLNERVKARLDALELDYKLFAGDPNWSSRSYVLQRGSTLMVTLFKSWRERIRRHAPRANRIEPNGVCEVCWEWDYGHEFDRMPWPCPEYLAVCEEIGIEP